MAESLEGLIERLEHELPNTKLKADGCGWALFKADDVEDAILALRLLGEVEKALEEIADGKLPPEKEGHYLAHRKCVDLARSALDKLRKGVG